VLDEPASAPFFSGLKPSKTRNSGDRLRNFSNDPTHKGEEKKRKEKKRKEKRAVTKFGNKFFGCFGFDET
jgi:hypothetical protein